MALETVVLQQGLFGYAARSGGIGGSALVGSNWGCGGGGGDEFLQILGDQTVNSNPYGNWNENSSNSGRYFSDLKRVDSYSPESTADFVAAGGEFTAAAEDESAAAARSKRRRTKCRKNKQDMESQRMTHIEVERNRRKQMNQYLSALRLIMPDSYVQRGDQASIIGGAINFVKELEHRLQFLSIPKEGNLEEGVDSSRSSSSSPLPFAEFFTFPQYSIAAEDVGSAATIADVEVTIVESHASIKIRTRRQPKQLVRTVSELQTLRLTVLHLNVTTVDEFVLYSLSVKVEDDCRLSSVDDIATAVYQLLGRIQEEAMILN